MMRIWVLAVMASLICSTAALAQAARPSDTITVRIRTIHNLCLGLCPDFSVSIAADGSVTRRAFEPGDKQVIETEQYTLGISELAGFRRRLAKIRPIGDRQFGRPCDAYRRVNRYGALILGGIRHGVSHYDIEWRGGAASSRLRACYEDERVRHALFGALAVARINPVGGRRLRAGQTASVTEW
jgi:hypothetical protein